MVDDLKADSGSYPLSPSRSWIEPKPWERFPSTGVGGGEKGVMVGLVGGPWTCVTADGSSQAVRQWAFESFTGKSILMVPFPYPCWAGIALC